MTTIAGGRLTLGKTYLFKNKADPTRALNVWCSSTYPADNLSNVCLWTADENDDAQLWELKAQGSNYVLKSVEGCKGITHPSEFKYLDLYTGSGDGANRNAQLYTVGATCHLAFEEGEYSDTVRIKLAGQTNNGHYLTANQDSNGTRTGKKTGSPGNVYFWGTLLTDDSQEWIPVDLDEDETGDEGGSSTVNGQKLVGPYTYSGISNDYGSDAAKNCSTCYEYGFHYGTDFKGRNADLSNAEIIKASGNGVVTDIRRTQYDSEKPLGDTLVIRYDNVLDKTGENIGTVYFRYCHLAEIYVEENEVVNATTEIARRGSSGSGCKEELPHLHLEATTKSNANASNSPTESGNSDSYKFDVRNVLFTKNSNTGIGIRVTVTDDEDPFNSNVYCSHGKAWYTLGAQPSYD